MITPDNDSEDAGGAQRSMAGEQCVPTEALAIEGVAPEVGEEFEYSGRGRVTRVEGDKTYFETTAVNGEAASHGNATEPSDDDEAMRAAREADAAAER